MEKYNSTYPFIWMNYLVPRQQARPWNKDVKEEYTKEDIWAHDEIIYKNKAKISCEYVQ